MVKPSELPVGSLISDSWCGPVFKTKLGWVFADGSGEFGRNPGYDSTRFDEADVKIIYNPEG